MRTFLISSLALLLATRSYAIFGVGDIVYDPVNNGVLAETKIETAINWATQLGKMEDEISNQLQQIQKAKDLLTTQNALRATIGDWQSVIQKAQSIRLQAKNLTQNYRLNLAFQVDYGQGLAPADAFGTHVELDAEKMKVYSNLSATALGAQEVLSKTDQEESDINQEIADTYTEMTKSGITQQEYEKLRGKLDALNIRLQSLQAQRRDALATIEAQQDVNRNHEAEEQEKAHEIQESTHAGVINAIQHTTFDTLPWR
jgi:hypothetical protein